MKTEIFKALMEARRAKRPVVLATRLEDGEQVLLDGEKSLGSLPVTPEIRDAAHTARREDKSRTIETGGAQIFVQAFNPPLRMLIVGAVHISQALAPMAAMVGYDVQVIDPRRAFASEERFPGVDLTHEWPDEALEAAPPDVRTAVITLTHDPKLDDPALEHALKSPAFYIGSLGSKKTHAARLERLSDLGFGERDFARIHGPIGLPIGAKSPAEIAVAILAEVTQTLRRAPADLSAAAE